MTLRTAQVQPALDVGEIDDIPFHFTADMVDGETIADADITCEAIEGEDADAQDMVTGAHLVGTIVSGVFIESASGGVVLQRFTGQTRDVSYGVRCVVTLSSGRKLTAAGELPVVKLAGAAVVA